MKKVPFATAEGTTRAPLVGQEDQRAGLFVLDAALYADNAPALQLGELYADVPVGAPGRCLQFVEGLLTGQERADDHQPQTGLKRLRYLMQFHVPKSPPSLFRLFTSSLYHKSAVCKECPAFLTDSLRLTGKKRSYGRRVVGGLLRNRLLGFSGFDVVHKIEPQQ